MNGMIFGQGYDPTSKKPSFVHITGSTATYVGVINISGSGVLYQFAQTNTTDIDLFIKIIIDGVTVFDAKTRTAYYGNALVARILNTRFNSSLVIQHKGSATGNITTEVIYALD